MRPVSTYLWICAESEVWRSTQCREFTERVAAHQSFDVITARLHRFWKLYVHWQLLWLYQTVQFLRLRLR